MEMQPNFERMDEPKIWNLNNFSRLLHARILLAFRDYVCYFLFFFEANRRMSKMVMCECVCVRVCVCCGANRWPVTNFMLAIVRSHVG